MEQQTHINIFVMACSATVIWLLDVNFKFKKSMLSGSLDMFTRDCSVNQSDTQKADGSPHNLAGIQPSNWASFIPSNGPFVMLGQKQKPRLFYINPLA